MWYDLAKYIHESINEEAREKNWWYNERFEGIANEIINIINASNVYPGKSIEKKAFKDLRLKMRNYITLSKKYGNGLDRGSKEVVEVFGEDRFELFTKRQCIFYCFLLERSGAWMNSGLKTYEDLLSKAGIPYSPTAFENMEDTITQYILKTDHSFERWILLNDDWKRHEQDYEKDLIEPFIDSEESKKNLTVRRIKELLEPGMNEEETTQGTRMSLKSIVASMEEIIVDPNNIYAETIGELFKGRDRMIKLILDTETRRQWYFLRMIDSIIEKQTENLLDASEAQDRAAFAKARDSLWLEKERSSSTVEKTWCDVTLSDNYDPGELEEAINVSFIVPAKVLNGFCECLDGEETIDINLETGEKNYNGGRLKSLIFENEKVVEGQYADDLDEEYDHKQHNYGKQYRTGESLFRQHLFSGRTVTKELLLLTVLVAYANGVKYSTAHVKNHILFNSRYPRDLETFNLFTEFYNEALEKMNMLESTDDRKKTMREIAGEYQEYYYHLRKRSLFYDILSGRHIS